MSRSEHNIVLEMCLSFLHDKVPEYIRDAGSYILSESGVQKINIQEGEVWEVKGNIQGDDFQVYTPKLDLSISDRTVQCQCNCSDAFSGVCRHVSALAQQLVDELRQEEGQDAEDRVSSFKADLESGSTDHCYELLDQSLLVSRVQTEARLSAGVRFPADEN